MMNRKVKSVIEKNYWAVQSGDTIGKGSPLTQADRDSLGGWTDDFEAVFDENGLILSCNAMDETGASLWKTVSFVEDSVVAKRDIYVKDTLSSHDQYYYGDDKFLMGGSRYRAVNDTLMFSVNVKTNEIGYPLEMQGFNAKGDSTWRNVYSYDAQNNVIHFERFKKSGERTFSYEVAYNDKGKTSKLTIRDADNNVIDFNEIEYEYDLKGNWTKAIIKNMKDKVIIEERTYTYFE